MVATSTLMAYARALAGSSRSAPMMTAFQAIGASAGRPKIS